MALRMALQALVCRAATSASLPRLAAGGAAQRSGSALRLLFSRLELAAVERTSSLSSIRGFHSSVVARAQSLEYHLDKELKHEKDTYEPPELATGEPPSGWKLEDEPGNSHLKLKKEHKGEQLQIDVLVNDQPEEPPFPEEEGMEDGSMPEPGIVFTMTVAKGNKALIFDLRSDGGSVEVVYVTYDPEHKEGNDDLNPTNYGGPVYDELDSNLQEAFTEYLTERGVDEGLAAYLYDLVNYKEQREYVAWLNNVKSFLAA